MPSNYYSRQGILSNSGLEHSGTLMRGINLSTNSNASLTSELNLQLQGRLTNNLNLIASVSDRNLPALPEGNTASLQEFDKVFISLYNDNHELTLGDIDLINSYSYFGKYQRKVLGAQYSTKQQFEDKQFSYQGNVAVGIAKGKFARQTVSVNEGNQGPYVLYGANNESNIVIVSGSERIFVDGKLVERSTDADYTIDYATAEITFMPRMVITSTTRVVVEFEYTEQSFSRYILSTNNNFSYGKGNVYLNIFYENDAKNQPVAEDLTVEQQQIMANVGVRTWEAYSPTADSVEFSSTEILYRKVDTIINGNSNTIYIYSTNPEEAHFRVRFAFVGNRMGSYATANSSANGRVYTWVGSQQGDYEPIQLLTTPKRKMLITGGGDFQIDSTTNANVDLALSNNNVNLFASNPSASTTGGGLNANIDKTWLLKKQHNIYASVKAMAYTDGFEVLERFTPVEYERDWNIEGGLINRHLQQYDGIFGYRWGNNISANATASFLNLGSTDANLSPMDTSFSSMQATKFSGTILITKNRLRGLINGSWLSSKQSDRKTEFARGNVEIAHSFKKLIAGIRGEFEHNQKHNNDILSLTSQAYHQEEIFIQTDSTKQKIEAFAKVRSDYLPKENLLKQYMFSQEVGASADLSIGYTTKNRVTATYRNIQYIDSTPTTPTNFLLVREELWTNLAKGTISTSILYELGTGVEPKQDFMYLDVGAGKGVYAWRDYNNNGVAELNEFEIAAFKDEASYIRVSLPSRTYVPSYTGAFAFQLGLLPSIYFSREHFLSRFSNTFSFSNSHKSLQTNFGKNANPFASYSNTDTSLISINNTVINTLAFTSYNSKLRIELSWQYNQSKYNLINGFEGRLSNTWNLNARYIVMETNRINAGVEQGKRELTSQYALEDKNYNISHISAKIGLEAKFLENFRTEINYKYTYKKNSPSSERATLHDAGLEAIYNFPKKGLASVNFGFTATGYNAETNTAIGYEMLQGFGIGRNLTWGTSFKRLLGGGLELNFIYSGRKVANIGVIHSGNVELRVIF
jgi:hypothetical protein